MDKQEFIIKRAVRHGLLFIERNQTIRSVAKQTGFSKTTVHLDLFRLKELRPALFERIKEKLDFNRETRHFRGGDATKRKFEKRKNK